MKRIRTAVLAALLALALAGCGNLTAKDMYALPKRSREYAQLQSAIDASMYGLTYSSPRSGENQQTVQVADLDGDGTEEYLVFAKGTKERPLQVLIFKQSQDGSVRNMAIIGFNALEFEQVEYVNFDNKPGMELVIGQRVSDQVLRNISVYTFSEGDAQLVLMSGYSRFTTCDLDNDGKSEIMVLRPGEAETQRGMAVLYGSREGQIYRSVETELSVDPSQIRRIVPGRLEDGAPAVYVSSSGAENMILTDIFAFKDGHFTNISTLNPDITRIQTLKNYYVYAEDMDGDGVMELPSLVNMKSVAGRTETEQNFLLRWSSLDTNLWPTDKLFTFHNYVGGWYMQLDSDWAGRVSVEEDLDQYRFYMWDEAYREATPLFTVYVLTGSTRDEDADKDGRFPLYRAEGVAYAARLEDGAVQLGLTQKELIDHFHLIRHDWKAGEAWQADQG